MNTPEELSTTEQIAIIGMAGRFPGAKDIHRFWQNLCDGVESVSTFSEEELIASGVDPAVIRAPGSSAPRLCSMAWTSLTRPSFG